MKYQSVIAQGEVFLAAGTVASHASAPTGFRQRDVRFLAELFVNWASCSSESSLCRFQNTQVARYVDGLTTEALARRRLRGRSPEYRLTRAGIVELVRRIVEPVAPSDFERFFFARYFLKNYGGRVRSLAEDVGTPFPPAVRNELENLLSVAALSQRQLAVVQRSMDRLARRIRDSRAMAQLVSSRLRAGDPFDVVVKEVERRHPYELNSQKPLSELVHSIPSDLRRWELEEGAMQRIQEIWEQHLRMLQLIRESIVP